VNRSARPLIERCFVPALFGRVCWELAQDPASRNDDAKGFRTLFGDAVRYELRGMSSAEHEQLWHQVRRVVHDVLLPHSGRSLATTYRAAMMLTHGLIEDGAWSVPEGGPFADTYEHLLAVVYESREENGEMLLAVKRSAERMARTIRRDLERRGYFAARRAKMEESA